MRGAGGCRSGRRSMPVWVRCLSGQSAGQRMTGVPGTQPAAAGLQSMQGSSERQDAMRGRAWRPCISALRARSGGRAADGYMLGTRHLLLCALPRGRARRPPRVAEAMRERAQTLPHAGARLRQRSPPLGPPGRAAAPGRRDSAARPPRAARPRSSQPRYLPARGRPASAPPRNTPDQALLSSSSGLDSTPPPPFSAWRPFSMCSSMSETCFISECVAAKGV